MLAVRTPPAPTHDSSMPCVSAACSTPSAFDLTEAGSGGRACRFPRTPGCPRSPRTGDLRDGAAVCELHDLDLSAWPTATRAICRRESAPSRRSALLHRPRRVSLFRCSSPTRRTPNLAAAGGASPRPRPGRGPHPLRQGVGAAQPALPRLRSQRGWLELVLVAQDLVAWMQHLCLTGEAAHWNRSGSATASSTSLPASRGAGDGCTCVCSASGPGGTAGFSVPATARPPPPPDPRSAPIPPPDFFGDPTSGYGLRAQPRADGRGRTRPRRSSSSAGLALPTHAVSASEPSPTAVGGPY